jgi:hypothetical protein
MPSGVLSAMMATRPDYLFSVILPIVSSSFVLGWGCGALVRMKEEKVAGGNSGRPTRIGRGRGF